MLLFFLDRHAHCKIELSHTIILIIVGHRRRHQPHHHNHHNRHSYILNRHYDGSGLSIYSLASPYCNRHITTRPQKETF